MGGRCGSATARQFGNSTAGFGDLLVWLPAKDTISRLVYEATGPYHAGFERALSQTCPLVKVNPLQARRFAQSKGTRVKTDAVDV